MFSFRDLYLAISNCDVHEGWSVILHLALIKRKNPNERTKSIILNVIVMMFHSFNAIRLSSSCFWLTDLNYLFGQTISNIGNVSRLTSAAAGVVLFQCTLYRLIWILRLLSDDKIVEDTTRRLSAERQTTPEQSSKRMKMNRLIIAAVVAGVPGNLVVAIIIYSGMLALNVMAAATTSQVCLWVFWFGVDLVMITFFALDTIIFPCMWFVVILNYCLDIDKLASMVQQLKGCERRHLGNRIADVKKYYEIMIVASESVNRVSAPFLFVIVSCSNMITCLCFFTGMYSNNIIMAVMVPAVGCILAMAATTVLYVASHVTRQSYVIHDAICSAAGNGKLITDLSTSQTKVLLMMMEQMESESHSLALVTTSGERYTSESLVLYLIETALTYLLLITYNQFLNYATI